MTGPSQPAAISTVLGDNGTSPQKERGSTNALQHLDLYRLAGPADLFALGFEDLLAEPAATLCEWADRAGPALPRERLEVLLEPAGPDARRATLIPHGARARELLGQLLQGGAAEP